MGTRTKMDEVGNAADFLKSKGADYTFVYPPARKKEVEQWLEEYASIKTAEYLRMLGDAILCYKDSNLENKAESVTKNIIVQQILEGYGDEKKKILRFLQHPENFKGETHWLVAENDTEKHLQECLSGAFVFNPNSLWLPKQGMEVDINKNARGLITTLHIYTDKEETKHMVNGWLPIQTESGINWSKVALKP